MDFELSEEHRMLKELVHRFVKDELMPLEAGVLKREAEGGGLGLGAKEEARLDEISKSLGLWGARRAGRCRRQRPAFGRDGGRE